MAKESFVLFKEFYPAIEPMSDLQLGRLFRAIFIFQREGVVETDPEIHTAFAFFKNQFRLDEMKYEKVVARNKSNGANGGRPEKPKEPTVTEKTQDNPNNPLGFQEPKKVDNDNVKDKGNEKENVNVKEKKDSSSSAKASDGLTKKFLDEYNIFLGMQGGVQEQFSIAGRTALSKIIKYFSANVERKTPGAAQNLIDEGALNAWKYIFAHFDKWEVFHQKQLKLEQINSNLINIIAHIRKPQKNHTTQQQDGKQQVTEIRRAAESIIAAANNPGNSNGAAYAHSNDPQGG